MSGRSAYRLFDQNRFAQACVCIDLPEHFDLRDRQLIKLSLDMTYFALPIDSRVARERSIGTLTLARCWTAHFG
jgi:hypothetical protein